MKCAQTRRRRKLNHRHWKRSRFVPSRPFKTASIRRGRSSFGPGQTLHLQLAGRLWQRWIGGLESQAVVRPADEVATGATETLYDLVADQTPLQHRFEFALWTIAVVRWLIWEEFQVKLSRSSTHRLLQQLGLSCQRPLHRAYEQDAARVERSKKEEFPRIRQMAKQAGAEIWFSDECGVRSDYDTGTTWGPKGSTPIVKSTGARFRRMPVKS